jgi:non-specific serine/threonine protein kinase
VVPETLLHYRIIQPLGSGGMGDVYIAEDTKLGRRVALKVLPRGQDEDPERRQRFEREARAVAALNHPNIVTIHAVEQADGVTFLAMELVDGKPLSEVIPSSGFPVDRLLKIAIPLASAVTAAHERGITHRDLKPANVMIGADGRLKVLDFGLAKLEEVAEPAGSSMTSLKPDSLTGEGRIVGTVAYMSPEQAEGRPVDHRTDIFSLGVVLYEMATGHKPFKGTTTVSTLASILRDTPAPISEVNAAMPRDLSRIVKRMLSKDPEHRYQTAKDVRNDLELLQEEISSGSATPVAAPTSGSFERAAPKRRTGL